MKTMPSLKLLGTSHIAQQSINEIKHAITVFQPDIIALELDTPRAHSLLSEKQNKISLTAITEIGVKGYLFAKIGQIAQQKLGNSVDIAPGSEMKTALELAKKNNLQIELIDQPIQITLKNFSKHLTWKEKFHFFTDILHGIFFPKKQLREFGLEKLDLRKVPEKELIMKIVAQLKKRYPNIYKTLIDDRNRYMVKCLVKLLREHPGKKILTIVGAGHLDGMQELLLKIDVIRTGENFAKNHPKEKNLIPH
ncbi:TraB/GumN family protein [Candidatus Woesearchaeota archaeon]|nr:TraB/GumN family protein [Candidatus Woesearchaeota archaeon]